MKSNKSIDLYTYTHVGTFHNKYNIPMVLELVKTSRQLELDKWLNSDKEYDPLMTIKVVKFELTKIGRVKRIDFSEK